MAPTPPPNSRLDPKVLARRQKDLDGFIEKYDDILDRRDAAYSKELQAMYKRIGRNVTEEIKAIYNQLQDANGVPITKEPIQPAKLRNMERQLKRLANLQAQLVKAIGNEEQLKKLERNLAYSYADGYYFSAFGLEQAAKVEVMVPLLTQAHVMGVLANPWLPDGNTYSDRLRANTSYLAAKMKKSLEEAVGNGWGFNRLARRIQDVAGEGYYNAVRLARTERTRAASQGANHLYMQNSDIMDGKRWNATLDSRTAPKDAENDGELYELDYDTPEWPGKAGERIPNHPNCRCKWTPVLSALGVSTRERIARDKYGERTYTNARNYRDYAQEKGLPDLDERLANDDPRRYLYRGEDMTAYQRKSGMLKAGASPAATAIATAYQRKSGMLKAGASPAATAIATAVTASAAVEGFQAAASIKAANEWAAQNLPIPKVDYSGYDLQLANEINEELGNLYQAYPEVEDINYVGTAQNRNKILYEWQVEKFLEKNKELFKDKPQATIDYWVKKYIKRKKVSGNTYAVAANKTWGPAAGISFNNKWAKEYDTFKKSVANDVKTKWHPEGTEQPVSVLIHEFGHSIDYFLDKVKLRDKYITPITKEALQLPASQLKEELSQYAAKNDREVVAEAFAEYRLNPKPRKWAVKIGEAIEAALEEYRKGLK